MKTRALLFRRASKGDLVIRFLPLLCTLVSMTIPGSAQVSFQSPPVGSLAPEVFEAYAAASADFNGDGIPDFAVVDGNVVNILLSRGGDKGWSGATYSLFSGFIVIAGDFNGDGKADLAVCNYTEVGILLGNGDGTFRQGPILPVTSEARAMAVADVNGDGKPDIVLTGADYQTQIGGLVQTLLGNGDGSFIALPAQGIPSQSAECTAIALADFTGDGKVDAALVCSDVYLAKGVGDGSFGAPTDVSGAPAVNIAAADLNGDGLPDLVYDRSTQVGGGFNQSVVAALSLGNGAFSTTIYQLPAASSEMRISSLVIGDFNGDSLLDIFAAGSNGAGRSVALPGTGAGTFGAPVVTWTLPAFAAFGGDYNHDGNLDVGLAGPSSVSFAPGRGDGSFVSPTVTSSSHTFTELRGKADFNGDGLDDLLIDTDSGLGVTLATGLGKFQGNPLILQPPPGFSVEAAAAGDVNGDGKADVVVVSGNQFQTPITIAFYPGDGKGNFGAAVTAATIPVTADFFDEARLADVNGDGKLDLILNARVNVVSEYQSLYVLLGNGDGTFQAAITLLTGSVGLNDLELAIADFNGDGINDIAALFNSKLNVFLGSRNGSFTQTASIQMYRKASGIDVSDFNGDGRQDIVVANGDVLLILTGVGDGTFGATPTILKTSTKGLSQVRAADLNGDGYPDLVVGDGIDAVDVFINDGNAFFQQERRYQLTPNQFLQTGHFTSDVLIGVAGTSEAAGVIGLLRQSR